MDITQVTGEIRYGFNIRGRRYVEYIGPMYFAESNGIMATGFTEYEALKKLEASLNPKYVCPNTTSFAPPSDMTEYERGKTDGMNTYNLILKRHYLEDCENQIRFQKARKKELEKDIKILESKLS